jgi:uncharacterized membrane protein
MKKIAGVLMFGIICFVVTLGVKKAPASTPTPPVVTVVSNPTVEVSKQQAPLAAPAGPLVVKDVAFSVK